jgi:Leucine-rich repeat (LRR) protein
MSDHMLKSPLSSLDLSRNLVTHEGAMMISQISSLTKLNLSNNKINDAGLILTKLAENTRLVSLRFSNPYTISTSFKVLAGFGKVVGKFGGAALVGATLCGTGGAIGLGTIGITTIVAESIGATLLKNVIAELGIRTLASGATAIAMNNVASTTVAIMGTGSAAGTIGGAGIGTVCAQSVKNKLNNTEGLDARIIQFAGKYKIGTEEAHALANNPYLTDLDLSDNHVTSEIIEILAKSPALTSLNLSRNNLNDEDGDTIVSIFKQNTKLSDLNLEGNDIPLINESPGRFD